MLCRGLGNVRREGAGREGGEGKSVRSKIRGISVL